MDKGILIIGNCQAQMMEAIVGVAQPVPIEKGAAEFHAH